MTCRLRLLASLCAALVSAGAVAGCAGTDGRDGRPELLVAIDTESGRSVVAVHAARAGKVYDVLFTAGKRVAVETGLLVHHARLEQVSSGARTEALAQLVRVRQAYELDLSSAHPSVWATRPIGGHVLSAAHAGRSGRTRLRRRHDGRVVAAAAGGGAPVHRRRRA